MIIRVEHNKNNPYYLKSRECPNNENVSWKAKGLHDYLMSKPNDWRIVIAELSKASTDREDATRAAINELIATGYMKRTRHTDDKGRVTEWELCAYESAQQPDSDSPDWEKPDVDIPDVDNRALVINETTVSNEKEESSSFSAKKRTPRKTKAKAQPQQQEELLQPTVTEAVALTPPSASPPSPTELTPQQRKFQLLCNIIGWDYKLISLIQKKQVAQTLGILGKAGYGEEELQLFFEKVWSKDWRWEKRGSHPTLEQVRTEIGKLKVTMDQLLPVRQAAMEQERDAVPHMLRLQQQKGYYA